MDYTSRVVKGAVQVLFAISIVTSAPSAIVDAQVEQPVTKAPAPVTVVHVVHQIVKAKPTAKTISGNCEKYRSLIEQYKWPVETAMRICRLESHGDPSGVGDSETAYPSCGLMQIRTLPGRPTCTHLKDPDFNIAYAYSIWKNEGFYPWSTYNS